VTIPAVSDKFTICMVQDFLSLDQDRCFSVGHTSFRVRFSLRMRHSWTMDSGKRANLEKKSDFFGKRA